MDQLIPSLSALVGGFRPCFRAEVFHTFPHLLVGGIVRPGPRTISAVWQATGRAARHHHDAAYALFRSAVWEWDELGRILAVVIVARLIPTGAVWLVVDDTLRHTRGAKVARGGFFLDAVTSARGRKNFRFGVSWVVLGLAVHLPFRPDRCFCLPVLWRAYRRKGTPGHRTRTEPAAESARLVAGWLPGRDCWPVADAAYLNATVLRNRPKNLRMIGPLRWDAALYDRPPVPAGKRAGRARKKGDRLPTPRVRIEDTAGYPGKVRKVRFGSTARRLRVQVIRGIPWYTGARAEPVSPVLVRDVAGQWRDEALLATSPDVSAEVVIAGYCRRWGVEVAFVESKPLLGLHDPRVRSAASVGRARPMAWFVRSVTILWYAVAGRDGSQAERDRPWYRTKKTPTFADMLGALRLQLWEHHVSTRLGSDDGHAELLDSLVNWLAAVR